MSSFYEYMAAPKASVAMDENAEKMVTIRRIFKINPKIQKELGHEDKDGDGEKVKPTAEDELAVKKDLVGNSCLAAKDDMSDFGSPAKNNTAVQKHCSDCDDTKKVAEDELEATLLAKLGGATIAMDLSPRHSKTPISECRAKDPRYCPYHGADFMTNQLNEEFKKAGIYATGGVDRLGQGKFKVQYSVPESKKGAATDIIDKFLSSPGFEEVSESDSDEIDAISKEVKMDHGNDDFAMKEEHLDTLEKDMKNGMEIDPAALYQLRKDHYELKNLSKAAHEAMERDGINIRTKEGREWAKVNPDWSKYRDAMEKFEADYNEIRGNADLAHIKTPEDCTELMGHLEKQITQVGDFVKATDEIEALKDKKGLKGKRGIPGTTDFNNAKGKIRFAIDGLKAARKQVESANASRDIKKMRAAAHSLELVLNQVNEGKEDIANALKQAESYKKVLEGYPDASSEATSSAPKAEEGKATPSLEKKEEAEKPSDGLDKEKTGSEAVGKPRDSAETSAEKVDKEAGAESHLDELMKKAHAELEASTKAAKERSDAKFGPKAAEAYLDSIKSKPSHEAKATSGFDKDRFVKRYDSDVFHRIADTVAKAKSAGKKLAAWTGIEDYDAADERDVKRFHSLQSLVKKLGGEVTFSKDAAGEDGIRAFDFVIDPDKAHELYGKLDARGGRVPHYEVAD